MPHVSRRAFFGSGALAAAIPLSFPQSSSSAAMMRLIDGGLPASFPSHDPDLAREVVGASHVKIDRVRELVTARPALAKAAWDWGFGDWETALGACSHTGRRDIAELLIAHGARPDIFTFAMLGQVDVVRAYCTANPGIQKIHGPHGITLLQHAINGGEQAAGVVTYLTELGDADIRTPDQALDADSAKPYVGEYRPQIAPEVVFHVAYQDKRRCLTIARDDLPVRFLFYQGNHEFAASGAADVRITFDVHERQARGFTIRDGDITVLATR